MVATRFGFVGGGAELRVILAEALLRTGAATVEFVFAIIQSLHANKEAIPAWFTQEKCAPDILLSIVNLNFPYRVE
jgi:hypothetical protein